MRITRQITGISGSNCDNGDHVLRDNQFYLEADLLSAQTKLSSSITVAQYQALEAADDRQPLAEFIRQRFDERYFAPVENSASKNGFAMMAIGCAVIETLESFYQGLADTKGASRRMFRDFFKRKTGLAVFGSDDDWFYGDIRCGILHQSETRGGWRVLRKGPLLDTSAKTINATRFLREMRKAVDGYVLEIQSDDASWANFRKKMAAVCENCSQLRPDPENLPSSDRYSSGPPS